MLIKHKYHSAPDLSEYSIFFNYPANAGYHGLKGQAQKELPSFRACQISTKRVKNEFEKI
jgi:hypothetical protein